ncbi:MAG TPA: hypothetical protein VLN47_06130 [Clostridiaceae bacterium]|nr:hypothetical protein [Clostridiaceae bacterium]
MKKVAGIWLLVMVFLTSSMVVSAKSIELAEKERTFLALRMSWKLQEPDEDGLYAHHMVNVEKNENFPEMSTLTLITEYYGKEGSYMGTREFSGQIPLGSIDFEKRVGTYLQISMFVEGLEVFYPQQRSDFLNEERLTTPGESGSVVHTLSLDIRVVPGILDRGTVDNGIPGGIFGSYHNRKNHSVRITGMLDSVEMEEQSGTLVLTDVPPSPPASIEFIRMIFH